MTAAKQKCRLHSSAPSPRLQRDVEHLRGCSFNASSILIALFHFHWQHFSNFFIQLHFPSHLLLIFPALQPAVALPELVLRGTRVTHCRPCRRCQGQFVLVFNFVISFLYLLLYYIKLFIINISWARGPNDVRWLWKTWCDWRKSLKSLQQLFLYSHNHWTGCLLSSPRAALRSRWGACGWEFCSRSASARKLDSCGRDLTRGHGQRRV